MPYDLFISYSRRDNEHERVSQLVERLSREFEFLARRPLEPFFDVAEIRGMEDWRHRILEGLRESRLLLVCVSPAYQQSEYCEWEFNEYLKHEVARGFIGEGVAPVYFVEVPGWTNKDFEQHCAEWIKDLRRRQYFDLHSWNGDAADAAVFPDLAQRVYSQIRKGEVVRMRLGNVDRHNPHFIGRTSELRRLHETVAAGELGVLAAVHGFGGIGKTALAVEYAHVNAGEYGGGCWQVRCEGRDDLRLALASLAPALKIQFNDAETLDLDLQFARVVAELRELSEAREPHRCLLLLDNVDKPALLEPAQTVKLPPAEWLHVIVTTRLGEDQMHGHHDDRRFISVEELPEDEAIALIESYQPGKRFSDDEEREAAREIVRLLGRLTLAVEIAAVFLGQFAGDVSCADFLERLRLEGLTGLETAATETTAGVLHGEKQLTATLAPTLESLTAPERLALSFTALLPADYVALPWIRALVAQVFSEIGIDAETGHPDPWLSVLRRLLSLRLLRLTEVKQVARMHRLVQEVVKHHGGAENTELERRLIDYAKERCAFLREGWLDWGNRWEIDPLRALSEALLSREHEQASWIANSVGQRLSNLARYAEAEPLMRRALEIDEQSLGPLHPEVATDLNNLASLLQATNRLTEAEPLMRRALVIDEQSLGPLHPKVATDLNNLAQLLQATNRLTEAEPLLRRALEIDEQSFGPQHPNVASDLNNLASLLQATNRLTEAEPLMRRALEIDEQSFGPQHPTVAIRLNNLASLLQATNRLTEAEPLMRRALEIFTPSLGADHPKTITVRKNLAALLALVEPQSGDSELAPDVEAAEPVSNLDLDHLAPEPESQSTTPQPYDDDVMFTVYRPATVKPQKWYSLLAFAHLSQRRTDAEEEPDPIAEVQRQAQQILGEKIEEYKQTSEESSSPVPRAGEITFKPFIERVEFNPASRSFRWEESVHREEFKLRASASLDGQTARGCCASILDHCSSPRSICRSKSIANLYLRQRRRLPPPKAPGRCARCLFPIRIRTRPSSSRSKRSAGARISASSICATRQNCAPAKSGTTR